MGNANTGNPFQFRDNSYVASVNLSWSKHTHQLRYGIELHPQRHEPLPAAGRKLPDRARSLPFNGGLTTLAGGPGPTS